MRVTRRFGWLCVHVSERTQERRNLSWCGVGPMSAQPERSPRVVCGFAAHAGKHLVIIDWAAARREKVWPHAAEPIMTP